MRRRRRHELRTIYDRLLGAFGPQQWWPATSPFEMMVGAILTQATRWRNVEQGIAELKRARALTPQRLLALRLNQLQQFIRPIGYFRQKTIRLRTFSRWYVAQYRGDARRMFSRPWPVVRRELLDLPGIGPETADAMLLYAGGKPVFVVDAYTTRLLQRHRLLDARATYEETQRFVMDRLPARATLYNEFHALLVAVGKQYCHRQAPDCEHCPLGTLPHTLER